MEITANLTHFQALNESIKASTDTEVTIRDCIGQRYIASGMSGKSIQIYGTPGNALGAYLNGSSVEVFGNAQDAVGDTMNDGEIIIHGNCGDGTGYGMRGGKIFVEGDCGYRGGIHMKSYQDKFPVLVIGGKAGSFLGEYQAGGIILVLGRNGDGKAPVGNFCGTGMHGGCIFLRCHEAPQGLPPQVLITEANESEKIHLRPYIEEYCAHFGGDPDTLLADRFYMLTPNPEAGYKQLYTFN